jgi:ABC-2 type transport system ATP-binding protein
LAKALIHDPQLIILDEPTTGLDPNQLVEIRNLISEIARDKTLILSTHIMQEVEAICHDVVIINKGKILAADALENLKSSTSEVHLELETEENLELGWFVNIGKVSFGKKAEKSLVIYCKDAAEGRKAIMKVVQEKNLNLISMNQSKKNLEQIFREITQ